MIQFTSNPFFHRRFLPTGGGSVAMVCAILAMLLAGCVTTVANLPQHTMNPPPSVPFSSFSHFKLRPVEFGDDCGENSANERACHKIEEHLINEMADLLHSWNEPPRNTPYGTLIIDPWIVEIKFISGGARFWSGTLSGSSVVVMHVDYIDEASGHVIAHGEFYQRANAMGAAYSFGGTDKGMLRRIARLVTTFTRKNFTETVETPTGVEP
jgi:hypothetical protein